MIYFLILTDIRCCIKISIRVIYILIISTQYARVLKQEVIINDNQAIGRQSSN